MIDFNVECMSEEDLSEEDIMKIGSALIKRAEIWAKENNLQEIRVRTNIKRELAHKFYKKEGYNLAKSWHLFVKS